ncbi:hypothetical protein RIF29_39863 [Crotalaria pallida]|uniref:Uncharacterized protein n=1 Tax=Crotalaria pallida TaxID=3830 RepID=A0AAN9E525_CROPI
MRDCHMATHVWKYFIPYSELSTFFSLDFFSWLRFNIQQSKSRKYISNWLDFFFSILYFLWFWRNIYVAEGQSVLLTDKCKIISNITKDITLYAGYSKENITKQRATINICWLPPPFPLVKLNSDGASKVHKQQSELGWSEE